MACKRDIEKLTLTDPIVRAHFDAWRCGRGITWDDMMCALVVSLVESKNAAKALALDCMNRTPMQPVVMPEFGFTIQPQQGESQCTSQSSHLQSPR